MSRSRGGNPMSLEDLRRQAEAEEASTEEVEQPEQEEAEEVEGEEPEADTEESETEQDTEEASEDFELELDGEPEPGQQKPSREDALVHKLTAKHHKYKEARDERDALAKRVEELEAMLQGSSQHKPEVAQTKPQQKLEEYPPIPVMYENGIDTAEQYQRAFKKWWADREAIDKRNAQRSETENQFKRRTEEVTRKLAERVGKFAVEHKIKDERVISAIERATSEIDGATKIEGSLAYLLDAVGDGSERVAYYIGTNDNAMSKVKGLLQEDPTGLRASAYMARLVGQLKPNHRTKTSKAPPPDQPVKGDGSTASAKALQDRYTKTKDPQEMLKLRKKARELGVKLT